MKYINTTNGEICTIHDIRRVNPNVSIPEDADCSSLGFTKLVEIPPPTPLPWHQVEEDGHIDGTQVWKHVPMTNAEIMRVCEQTIQRRLDDFARTRNYDTILSACSYVNSFNPTFKDEGTKCSMIRDATWNKCYEIMNEVIGGTRSMPSLEQLISELPVLDWSE